jgi:3-dehydroquinate synthase
VSFVESAAAVNRSIAEEPSARYVVDRRLVELHPTIFESIDRTKIHAIEATEHEKTLQGVERLCRFLQATDASKSSTLIVIGGGVPQDIGAFVAHIYYRGLPYRLVPTTLLSMADSCIGAKCGINLGEFKNQLGFFQSPREVIIWSGFTETLAHDDIRSGFGEILKLAIVADPSAYEWIEGQLSTSGFSLSWAQDAIYRSLDIKRSVIEQDEHEGGLRKTLNYGHSFGHALEGVTEHEIPHGLAVAWGIDIANYFAFRTGLLPESTFLRIHEVIAAHYAFTLAHDYAADDIVRMMGRDKKAADHRIQLVLLAKLGELRLVPTQLDDHLRDVIQEYIERFDVLSAHQPAR